MPNISDARASANKRWDDKNKDKKKLYRYRSYARKYVRELADIDDLVELTAMIEQRKIEIESTKKANPTIK
ncbi:hypothetical protein KNP65_07005 [Latilactobacillus curvatus]|uniref:hypothetical protein n=1 Tax=Latilactobacillus curvatus TaxID=28038 RepID=UPI002410EDD6|nr:hypothetical protein [Latilactobacillus curvatus]MDG2979694.1 hypothetical protein [Latilactobacillus curvatus]WCZ55033.1 hypothetical protein [Latilactobacillus phage TMW 1.2272 P1]